MPMDIGNIALALGSSLTAGLNLYITVLTLGLMQRFGVLDLPASALAPVQSVGADRCGNHAGH